MIISFGIIIAGPLFLLVGIDQKFYFGYTGFALYHNPTFNPPPPVCCAYVAFNRKILVFQNKYRYGDIPGNSRGNSFYSGKTQLYNLYFTGNRVGRIMAENPGSTY